MPRVTVYSAANCAFCTRAKTMLEKWDIDYDEVRIDGDSAAMKQFIDATNGARTVPQIIIDGKPIGGFTELTELHMDGELDDLMKSN
jgi:glutaredoxin 3